VNGCKLPRQLFGPDLERPEKIQRRERIESHLLGILSLSRVGFDDQNQGRDKKAAIARR